MKPRDLFGVAVRVAGVFALLWGLWDLVNAALFYTDYFRNPDMSFRFYLIYGWASIFIGLVLIRTAPVFVTFAYGNDITEAEPDTEGSVQMNDNQK